MLACVKLLRSLPSQGVVAASLGGAGNALRTARQRAVGLLRTLRFPGIRRPAGASNTPAVHVLRGRSGTSRPSPAGVAAQLNPCRKGTLACMVSESISTK